MPSLWRSIVPVTALILAAGCSAVADGSPTAEPSATMTPTATATLEPSPTSTPSPTATPTVNPFIPDTAEKAEDYADVFGVSVEEATRRVRLIERAEETLETITLFADYDLLGYYFFHEPDLRIWLRLRNEPDDYLQETIANSPVPIDLTVGEILSGDEIQRRMEPVREGFRTEVPGLQGMGTNIRTGEFALDVFIDAGLREKAKIKLEIEKLTESVYEDTGVPIQVEYGPPVTLSG